MRSEFESRETFECIFGGEDGINLSKDETGEYTFQPSRFAYSFFFVAWQYRQTEVDELERIIKLRDQQLTEEIALSTKYVGKFDELQKRVDASLIAFEKLKDEINELYGQCDLHLIKYLEEKSQVLEQALKGGIK